MTENDFRKLALSLPEATEGEHMDHPDFRVRGKIFATIVPDRTGAMVKLTPEQQEAFVESDPKVFQPIRGGWGKRGATKVILTAAKKQILLPALVTAWRNTAPKKLSDSFENP